MKNSKRLILLIIIHFIFLNKSIAQGKKTYNVAIVVHNGVELFDFAGPGEVFSSANGQTDVANFNVFTIAPSNEQIKSQRFLKVEPNYSIQDNPEIDILIIPGGKTFVLERDTTFMNWVKNKYDDLDYLFSVCTGAFVPGELGLLNDLKATTHHQSIAAFEQWFPKIDVQRETKFVDNGKIITAGGVSSGTEGSLHMIHRLVGIDAAKAVAKYMEYANWNPDLGLINYENETIKTLKDNAINIGKGDFKNSSDKFSEILEQVDSDDQIGYGELEQLAFELLENKQFEQSRLIFEKLITLYPYSVTPYNGYRQVLLKQNKEVPPTEEEFINEIKLKGIEVAYKTYMGWVKKYPGWKIFKERAMNQIGYGYVRTGEQEKDINSALMAFKLNTEAYPTSFNVWDSLGEAYKMKGDTKLSIKYYKKSLELNPNNSNAKKMLLELENN